MLEPELELLLLGLDEEDELGLEDELLLFEDDDDDMELLLLEDDEDDELLLEEEEDDEPGMNPDHHDLLQLPSGSSGKFGGHATV